MAEYGFSLTLIFPYKARMYDSVLIREDKGQRKPVFLHILRRECYEGLSEGYRNIFRGKMKIPWKQILQTRV